MQKDFPTRRAALGLTVAGGLAGLLPRTARAAAMPTVHYAMQKVPEDFVYRAKDWAKPYGVKVVSAVSPSAVRSMQALFAGQADLADSGSGPVLSAISRAPGKLVIVAATHSGGQRHELMVKPDAPYKSLADLKGKRIAIPVGSGAYIIFELYLAKKGLSNRDFQVVNMKPGDMGSALASGQVAAALTWEPTPSILVTKGVAKVIQSFGEVSPDPALLVASRSFVQHNRAALVRVLASMIDMYAVIKSDPVGAGKMAARVEGESGASVDPAAFTRAFRHMTFDMHITKMDIAALQTVGDFMLKAHRIPAVPDFAKLVETGPLEEAFQLAHAKA